MFEQVTQRVCIVAGPEQTDPIDALSYLVHTKDRGVLIDAGCGPSALEILGAARALGVDADGLELVLLTHNHIDHVGGAATVRDISGAPLAIHELDAAALENGDQRRTAAAMYGLSLEPLRIDRKLSGASGTIRCGKLELEWEHAPGHTPGSIVVYLREPEGLVVFGQDVHGPFHAAFDSDVERWRESMQRIVERQPDILCEGHFGVIRGRDQVRRFIEQHLAAHR